MSNLPKIGLDVGSAAIKVVELAPAGPGKWKLLTAASMAVADSGIVIGKTAVANAAGVISKIMREAGTRGRRVVAALAEEQVSTHVVEMPVMNEGEIEQALGWQVEQYIPLPRDQAVWSWEIVKKDEVAGVMEVMLVAVAKSLAEWYREVLEASGLEPVGLETELAATARADVAADAPLSVIVDVGARSTDMGMVRGGQLVFSRTVPTAGEAFTRAIESTLGLDPAQAEKYKNTYGFSATELGGKLVEAMKPVMGLIAAEVRKTMDFYSSKHAGEVAKIVTLSGGVAVVPDVVGVLSAALGMEVVVANPFARVELDGNQEKALAGSEPFYAVAVGLAMKEV